MEKPQAEVLGVYRVPVTDELFKEQFEILYGYPMLKRERAEAERIVVVGVGPTYVIELKVKLG